MVWWCLFGDKIWYNVRELTVRKLYIVVLVTVIMLYDIVQIVISIHGVFSVLS